MRAVIVENPGDVDALEFGEVDTPEPGPGEVLVKTVASGVNRADVLQRQGHYPPPPGVTDIIGLEASGVVAKVGAVSAFTHKGVVLDAETLAACNA